MTQLNSPTPKRIWASLITNTSYLPGLLTLHHSLYNPSPDISSHADSLNPNPPEKGSQYPFVALYTSTFPPEGLKALQARGIRCQLIPSVTPAGARKYEDDPRFAETWTKLIAFSLVEYERIVLLDGDVLVRRNMDELMDLPLDSREIIHDDAKTGGQRTRRVFAAAHACACNPMKKPQYPLHWIPENCAYTTQHPHPLHAQTVAPSPDAGVGMLNSGVLVLTPSTQIYGEITSALDDTGRVEGYDFPDQELLSDIFRGRWVALPYVYNALKTLRWDDVHGSIWRDEMVRAVHYIFALKPWHEGITEKDVREDSEVWQGLDVVNRWWWEIDFMRRRKERGMGVEDVFSTS